MAAEDAPSRASIITGFLGEFLREAAVLIAVFAPLDHFLENKPLTFPFVLITMGIVAVVLVLGIFLEVQRQ